MNRAENEFLERMVHEMHDLLLNYARIRVFDYDSAYDVVIRQGTVLRLNRPLS